MPKEVEEESIYDIKVARDLGKDSWMVEVGVKAGIDVQKVRRGEIILNVTGVEHETVLAIPISVLPAVVSVAETHVE